MIEVGAERIEWAVSGTGGWDDYRRLTLGAVTLAPGRHRLEVRPGGPIREALIDLRAVELLPTERDAAGRDAVIP